MADAMDLKSIVLKVGREGSFPSGGTKIILNMEPKYDYSKENLEKLAKES